MGYEVIHLKPTLDTSAYADSDILFEREVISLPAKACKILSIQAIWSDAQATDDELFVGFFRENVQVLGGNKNDPAAATSALFRPDSGSFLGFVRISQDSTLESGLGDPSFLSSNTNFGDNSGEHLGPHCPIVIKSGTEDYKIYVAALLEVSAGITCGADSLDIFIHVEY